MREMGKDSYCDEGNVVDMVKQYCLFIYLFIFSMKVVTK